MMVLMVVMMMANETSRQRIHWSLLIVRDGPLCWLCALPVDPDDRCPDTGAIGGDHPTVDHVAAREGYWPQVGHWLNDLENLRVAHLSCNASRGKRPPSCKIETTEQE